VLRLVVVVGPWLRPLLAVDQCDVAEVSVPFLVLLNRRGRNTGANTSHGVVEVRQIDVAQLDSQ